MSNGEMWDKLFKRVDSFRAELKPTQTDTTDALILAYYALLLSFQHASVDYPSETRRLKDDVITALRKEDLSNRKLELIAEELKNICDSLEQGK